MPNASDTPEDGVMVVIHTNATVEVVPVGPELSDIIGCRNVDVVRLTTVLDLWVDDEFLYSDADVNPLASRLASRHGCDVTIQGRAVVAGVVGEGTVGLTADRADAVVASLASLRGSLE